MKGNRLLCLVFCFFILGTVSASEDEASEPQIFDEIDVNGDGYISKEESTRNTGINKNWMTADTNKDGKLDVSEFSAFEGRNMVQPPEELVSPEPGAAPTN